VSEPVQLSGRLLQTIDYDGFRRFMYIYVDSADMPDELYRHLFLSFIKRPSTSGAAGGGELSAPARPNGDVGGPAAGTCTEPGPHESPSRLHGLLAGKLHELTEKLHSFGGSGAPPGRRHRAGSYKCFMDCCSAPI